MVCNAPVKTRLLVKIKFSALQITQSYYDLLSGINNYYYREQQCANQQTNVDILDSPPPPH